MPGEQSVYSDEASDFRKILERPSPNSSYSFRTELLSDADSHKGHKSKPHKSSSHRRHRSRSHRDRSGAADVTALDARHLTRLFARDEAEAIEMRKVLIRTSERLEQESRRAAEAETRAREAEARVLALQAARQTAQANALREQEALKAYQAQVETARNEILRAQKELNIMAAEKERAEVEAANERSKARAMAKEMEIQLALEQGRREGKTQGFVDGRKEGWHLGTKHAYKEIFRDEAGLSSRSTMTPPFTSAGQQPTTSTTTTASAPQPTAGNMPEPVRMPEPVTIPEPVRMPEPVTMPEPVRMPEPVTIPEPITMPVPMIPQTKPTVTSTRTATPHTTHKRSGSLTQTSKSHTRVDSEFELPSLHAGAGPSPEPALVRNARYEDVPRPKSARLTPSPSQERLSPIPIHNAIPSPRHSPVSPLPGGYIPLQENGRVSLPPPHELDPPPPSPHSPSMPLPPQINNYRAPPPQNLVPPGVPTNAPSITVQEPTPPEPFPMPEPHLSPNPNVSAENNSRSNRGLGRNIARGESPPLPPLPPGATGVPTGRLNKGKQRQRTGPPRAGTGLHVPGRKSPSDTSTEYSQFDIFEDEDAPSKFDRTQLSVIMEGSSVGGSPEPESDPRLTNLTRNSSMKSPSRSRESPLSRSPLNIPGQGPGQGILNDPLEYAEYADLNGATLTPTQLAHRREVAEQLRHSPSEEAIRNQARSIRDDVSIKSSTTRASAPPKKRILTKMPERLGASKDVEVLEKQAEMYDAFGTGHFPTFPTTDSLSSPDDVVSTRTPDHKKGHRRAMSSSTTIPGIMIEPPSRPSSKGSKIGLHQSPLSPSSEHTPIAAINNATPSRRHSMQGSPASPSRVPLPHSSAQVPRSLGTPGSESKPFIPPLPMTPSRVPLPQTTSQMPTSLLTPHSAESGLPPGFVPFIPPQGPPSTPSKVPLLQATGHTPFGLGTVDLTLADHSLPAGFVPQQGPPEILEAYAIKTPGVKSSGLSKTPQHSTNALAQVPNTLPIQSPSGFPAVHLAEYASKTPEFNTSGLPSRTPHKSTSGLPFEGSGNPGSSYTPAGIPLPMSTATATWGLPDNTTRGTGRTAYNGLPSAQAQPNFNYPTTPARMPLPASVVGSPQGSTTHQTPWSGWGGNGLAAGATPGAMPSELLGRPSSLYAGDGGLNKKVSSASLASSYKKFDPSTYVDPAYLASSSAEVPPDPTLNDQTNIRSRPGSVRSVRSTRSIKLPWGSPYAATIETITDDKII